MVARNQRSGSKSSISYKEWRSGSEEGLAKNDSCSEESLARNGFLVRRKGENELLFGGTKANNELLNVIFLALYSLGWLGA